MNLLIGAQNLVHEGSKNYGSARRALASVKDPNAEAILKASRAYGGSEGTVKPVEAPRDRHHEHFGLFLVSCTGADIRPLPNGVQIYADDRVDFHPLPAQSSPRRSHRRTLCRRN